MVGALLELKAADPRAPVMLLRLAEQLVDLRAHRGVGIHLDLVLLERDFAHLQEVCLALPDVADRPICAGPCGTTPLGPVLASCHSAEVGRLAGVSGLTIGQWARRGYIRSSQSSGRPRLYSFQDVAEAIVVHELLDRGVPHRDIKRAISELRERFGMGWPLTHARLATTGERRVVAEADEAVYDIGKRGWQQMNEEDLTRIVGLLQRGGWATRELPDLEHIEVDPDRLSGRPTIRGRRVPAAKVARLSDTDQGREILRHDYDLSDQQIADARRWWNASQAFLEAA